MYGSSLLLLLLFGVSTDFEIPERYLHGQKIGGFINLESAFSPVGFWRLNFVNFHADDYQCPFILRISWMSMDVLGREEI